MRAISVFVIKLLAAVSMLIDHLSYVMRLAHVLPRGQLYFIGRAIGRPAFVLYCFLLVNGFDKTRDRKLYLTRLVLFALISQIPFTLAFSSSNFAPDRDFVFRYDVTAALPLLLPLAAWFFSVGRRRFDLPLLWLAAALAIVPLRLCVGGVWLAAEDLNVFYTLAVSMALMLFFERLSSPERNRLEAFFLAAAIGVELVFVQQHADYGLIGVGLILALYFCRGKKLPQLAVAAVWCAMEYHAYLPYLFGALSALLPLALYNGKLGPKLRTAFYVFYPAHLALLGAVFAFLAKR